MTPHLRSRLFISVNIVLGAVALVWMLERYGAGALVLLGMHPRWGPLTAFFAAAALNLMLLGGRWRGLLGSGSPRPGLVTFTLMRSAAHMLAVLIPSGKLGGDPLRAWLATRLGVPAARSVASTLADRVLEIGTTIPFSVFFAVALVQAGVPGADRAGWSVAAGSTALVVGVSWAVRRLHHGAGLVTAMVRRTGADRWPAISERMNTLIDAESALLEISRSRRRVAEAVLLGVLSNVVVLLEFWLLLRAFDLPSGPTSVIAAVFATGAAHMLPVPAGVGVLEGAQIWIFQALGHAPEVGLAVGLATRGRELLWMSPGVAYFLAQPALFREGSSRAEPVESGTSVGPR